MAFDDKYIYAPIRTMSIDIEGKKMITKKINGEIAVFNKNTGEYLYKIINDRLNKIDGGFYIFGVTDKYIIATVSDNDGIIKDLFNNENIGSGYAFIILENPIK